MRKQEKKLEIEINGEKVTDENKKELLANLAETLEKITSETGLSEFTTNCLARKGELMAKPNIVRAILEGVSYFEEFEDLNVSGQYDKILAWLVSMEEFGLLKINDDYEGKDAYKKALKEDNED